MSTIKTNDDTQVNIGPPAVTQTNSKGIWSLAILSITLLVIILPITIANLVLLSQSQAPGADVDAVTTTPTIKMAPPLPGIAPSTNGKTHLIFAQDVNYPPYAYLSQPPEGTYEVAGFGVDFAKGMAELCDIDITILQTKWADCWQPALVGGGLNNGHFHGCMTYTHTSGQRTRFVEFSHSILNNNKPAGILTRLVDGNPVITGMDFDFTQKRIADVKGWAPTVDGLKFATNMCYEEEQVFELGPNTMVIPEDTYTSTTENTGYDIGTEFTDENDVALAMLLDGVVDGVWIYADQVVNSACSDPEHVYTQKCELWAGFGTKIAYVQTGLFGHAVNGTTLTMSKKGSGVPGLINECIAKFIKTEGYKDICMKHTELTEPCFRNEFFDDAEDDEAFYAGKHYVKKTMDLTTACSDGYCPCDAVAAS